MPSLMLFVACERVSFDSATSAASLIGVFQGFTVFTSAEPPLNDPTIISPIVEITTAESVASRPVGLPLKWAAFSLWRRVPEDSGRKFTQVCELIKPSGKQSVRQVLNFEMTHNFQRNTIHVQNFPVDESGDYRLRLFIQVDGGDPQFVTEYLIPVTHSTDTKT